jgi:5'-nucleotidase/UDP-sugar diphosphatase
LVGTVREACRREEGEEVNRLWLGLALGCQTPKQPLAIAVQEKSGHLVIAHTNDLHAHFSRARAEWLEGQPNIGGFVEIDAHLDALDRAHGESNVLVLDGGDVLTGTPLMEFETNGVRGGAMLDFMVAAGTDAWVLGNHEFDLGWDNIQAMVEYSPIPALSANLDALDGSGSPALRGLKDHHIFERAGIKVGVFGLTTDGLAHLTGSDATTRMVVVDTTEAARAQVALLEPQVDLVVALTHIGIENDRRLAKAVSGIDLIVGGHSHTPLVTPEHVGDTWIVQAGSYGRNLGVTEFDVVDGRIINFKGELRTLIPGEAPGPVDASMVRMAKEWSDRIEARFDQPVGVREHTLSRAPAEESPLGRWSSDMVRAFAQTDIGIYNPGGLRADLVAGTLTRRSLYEVFPFTNAVVRFEMSGSEVVGLLLRNANAMLGGRRSAMQLSGIHCTWRVRDEVPELIEVRIGGEPLDPDGQYSAATNSYVVDRWSYNLGFEPRNATALSTGVFEAAVDIAGRGPVISPSNPRMVRIDGR